jgi:hypothetical protein
LHTMFSSSLSTLPSVICRGTMMVVVGDEDASCR